jgi:hypothetical protein
VHTDLEVTTHGIHELETSERDVDQLVIGPEVYEVNQALIDPQSQTETRLQLLTLIEYLQETLYNRVQYTGASRNFSPLNYILGLDSLIYHMLRSSIIEVYTSIYFGRVRGYSTNHRS